jgi:hypothetical protein
MAGLSFIGEPPLSPATGADGPDVRTAQRTNDCPGLIRVNTTGRVP